MLRQNGFEGAITLLGEEPLAPYQRPPLSKAWLKGEVTGDDLELRPRQFYEDANIKLRTGVRVHSLDRERKMVVLQESQAESFDVAILATGALPIRLPVPGADLQGVLTLRTAQDAQAIKNALGLGRRIAVIGGGYIGLEVAASAVSLGGQAVVLERAPQLLARSASATIADFYLGYHRARGVDVHLNAEVVGFEGSMGRVTGVRLASGEIAPCDVALVGVGVRPNADLAQAAGIACDRGVLVNGFSQTSDPSVYAVGDCSRRPSPLYGRMICPESVPSALEQAKQAAAHISGKPAPSPEVPWNWSDQFDIKLQVAGFAFEANQHVVRGDPSAARFAVFHLQSGRLLQVEAINSPAEFMAGRQLILRQARLDPAKLADVTVPMTQVAA